MDEFDIIIVRPFVDSDKPCVYSTWRKALWFGGTPEEKDSKRYFKQKTKEIDEILLRSKVRVACKQDSPSMILGYAVYEDNMLHFIYVKADYRKQKIGSLLLPKNIDTVTKDLTKIGRAIAQKKNFIIQGEEHVRRENEKDQAYQR